MSDDRLYDIVFSPFTVLKGTSVLVRAVFVLPMTLAVMLLMLALFPVLFVLIFVEFFQELGRKD